MVIEAREPHIKRMDDLRANYTRLSMLGSFNNLVFYQRPTEGDVLEFIENSVPLRNVIDVEQIVNRHVLRQSGIEPGAVRVILSPITTSFSIPEFHIIALDFGLAHGKDTTNEDLYVTFAHELAHVRQQLSGDIPSEVSVAQSNRIKLHADRPTEQEAFFWEATQGARFGWGREELARHNKLTNRYTRLGIGLGDALREEVRREGGTMPVLSRRPVPVRSYRRRRR